MESDTGARDADERFAEEARAAGLSLPTARRLDLRLATVVIAVLVVGSLVVGYETNWLNLNRPPPNPLAALPGCSDGGISVSVETEAGASASLASAWPALASAFASATGNCLSVTAGASPSGLASLAGMTVDAVVGPVVPGPSNEASLAAATYDVPLLVSPLVVLANVGGSPAQLNLTSGALAGVYLGTVTSWSDPALTSANPGLHSDLAVTPVHLAGPSAADALFTTYLAERNGTFRSAIGSGANVTWPVGRTASASNVTAVVMSTPGAIGFEPTDVCPYLPMGVVCAAVQAGPETFADPTSSEVAAAADLEANSSSALAGGWANVSGVAPANSTVYPMVETTFAIVYRDLGTSYGPLLGLNQSKWLVALLFWVASDTAGAAGRLAETAGYSSLPGAMAIAAEETALNVTYLGNWILLPAGALQEGTSDGGNETGEF